MNSNAAKMEMQWVESILADSFYERSGAVIDFSHYLSNTRSVGCLDDQRGVPRVPLLLNFYLFQRCPGQLNLFPFILHHQWIFYLFIFSLLMFLFRRCFLHFDVRSLHPIINSDWISIVGFDFGFNRRVQFEYVELDQTDQFVWHGIWNLISSSLAFS